MVQELLFGVYIFVLAVFVGFELISKIPPILHTPLMSGSNAISGITIVGAMIATSHASSFILQALAFTAVVFAVLNVVGGYLITDRMLRMFKKKSP
ncbi:MAG: NAD(P) transhydrogenase subunit alpha [Elusimicrobia bacterium]|nr:NAD(P) transhydrogenase subunit alpha [Elusimicrobiota bacterium]